MTDEDYQHLKKKYLLWKQFLVTELDNYEAAKKESNPIEQKKVMMASYEAVRTVVVDMERLGIHHAARVSH